MLVNFRHGIVSSAKNVAQQPAFLQMRGQSIGIVASSTPVVLAIAHKQSNYLVTIEQDRDVAWTSIEPTLTYLYIDVDLNTGVVSYGQTTTPPIIQPTTPINAATGQHWFDTTLNSMRVKGMGAWQECARLFVGTSVGGIVTCTQFGSQIGVSGNFPTGKIAFDSSGKPISKSTGEFWTTDDVFYVNGTVSAPNAFGTQLQVVSVAEAITPMSVVAYSSTAFNLVRLAQPADAGYTTLAVAMAGASTNEKVSVVCNGIIINPAWRFLNPNSLVWVGPNGTLSTTPDATNASQPIGRVVDVNAIVFNPLLSASAGGGGEMGPRGPEGAQGPAGATGLPGAQGPAGPQGLTGATGPAGINGTQGPVGPQGLTGPASTVAGPTGPQGPVGATGPAGPAGVAIGTVTSVDVSGTPTRITSSGGPITSSGNITLDLATTGVTAGSYNNANISVDVYGRVVSVSDGVTGTGGGASNSWIYPNNNIGLGNGVLSSGPGATYSLTGFNNIAIGTDSLALIGPGFDNIAIGAQTLSSNIDGYDNIAIGYSSSSNNTSGNENIAIGSSSLLFNTTGFGNTAIGRSALMSNTIGNSNISIGGYSLQYNIDGYSNIGIGNGTLQNNTTGFQNIVIGNNSGNFNTTGDHNTVMGDQAFVQNTTGYQNTAIGSNSLVVNSTGIDNTAVGSNSLMWNTGSKNTAVGTNSLNNNQAGNFNTSIGANSLLNNQNGSNNVAVGYLANQNGEFNNTTCLGYNTSVTNNNQVQLGSSGTSTYVYGTVQNRSDLRDKADVRDTVLGLDFINNLRPVDYKWDMREDYKSTIPIKAQLPKSATPEEIKANDLEYKTIVKEYIEANKLANLTHDGSKKRSRYHHGFIAQEVKSVIETTGIDFGGFQNHSASGGEDVMSIGYDEFIAPLIKAVQELSLEKTELKNTLENTMNLLKSTLLRIDALENK